MGILDTLRKSKEKKEQTTPPPEGHTLAEIMQDKDSFHLFGELLKKGGYGDLATRIIEGKPNEGDIAVLEKQRKIFSEKITKSEKVEEWLTEESIINIARKHPRFAEMINLAGSENAIEAIRSQLKEISITDEVRFNKIVKAIGESEKHKNGEYKTVNDTVEKLLKDNKISSQEYLDVLAIEDSTERNTALEKLADKYGSWWKGNKKDLFDALRDNAISSESQIDQLNKLEKNIGSALSFTLRGNDSMRNALFSGVGLKEKSSQESKSGFSEVKKETLDEGKFNKDWEDLKTKESFSTKSPSEQDALKKKFINEQQKLYKDKNEGKGFWHSILAAITEALINSKEATLK